MSQNTKWLIAAVAVFVFSFGTETETCAQRGFRVGNFFQAGGGQGFRLGGPRAGMHFGGGQGATIGTQRYGMRFGNGQGARFGGQYYGMQFGGGQGTQFGRFATTPSVNPGTYYYASPQTATYPQSYYRVRGNPTGYPLPANSSTVIGPGSQRQPTVSSNSNPDGRSATGLRSARQPTTTIANPGQATQRNSSAASEPEVSSQAEVLEEVFEDPQADAPGQRKTKVYSILNNEPEVDKSPHPAATESDK